MRKSAAAVAGIFILLAIFSLLFFLRLVPAINNSVEFTYDSAYYLRMTEETLRNGDVPSVDTLSSYPEGRNLKDLVPTGMFQLCASFHKLLNLFYPIPLNRSILFFCAFWGSLIFLPVYFLSYEIYRNRMIAYLSAFLAGIIPAYLHRTYCYWYRYEIVAVPILFFSLLFFLKAFGKINQRRAFIYGFLSILFLIFASYVWRLYIIFAVSYAVVILYLWVGIERPGKNKAVLFFSIAGGLVLLGSIFFAALRTSAGQAPNFICTPSPVKVWGFTKMVVSAVLEVASHGLGLRQHLSDYAKVLFSVEELRMVGIINMFTSKYLSFAGIFLVFYFIAYFRNKTLSLSKQILFVITMFFLALTTIHLRGKIILGPLVALTAGESIQFILGSKNKWIRNFLIVIVLFSLTGTAFHTYRLTSSRSEFTMIRPDLKQAIIAINEKLPKNAVVLADWPYGYFIQTYCHRSTIMDGLLESPQVIKRAIALGKIYYLSDEAALLEFSREHGVTHILVSNREAGAYAIYAGVDFIRFYKEEGSTPLARQTLFYKLVRRPETVHNFSLIYSNEEFMLYEVKAR